MRAVPPFPANQTWFCTFRMPCRQPGQSRPASAGPGSLEVWTDGPGSAARQGQRVTREPVRVLTTGRLLAAGLSARQIRRLVVAGGLAQLRPGVYAGTPLAGAQARGPAADVLLTLAAALAVTGSRSVGSHQTAATVHAPQPSGPAVFAADPRDPRTRRPRQPLPGAGPASWCTALRCHLATSLCAGECRLLRWPGRSWIWPGPFRSLRGWRSLTRHCGIERRQGMNSKRCSRGASLAGHPAGAAGGCVCRPAGGVGARVDQPGGVPRAGPAAARAADLGGG